MNAKQAKKLCMPEVLSKMGYTPTHEKKSGNEVWYRSPLRNERTPSFHISYIAKDNIWIWKDFGDEGGNILSFIMRHQNTNVKGALAYLRSIFPNQSWKALTTRKTNSNDNPQSLLFTFHEPGRVVTNFNSQNKVQDRGLDFVRAKPIQHPAIFNYLEQTRKLPRSLIEKYLLEVHYRNKALNKGFFAFGMQNKSGGYEIRNASDHPIFKSALIERNITHFRGREGHQGVVSIFEGMTDYLSLLAMLKVESLNGDTIIMHSTSTYERTTQFIKKLSYTKIHSFLDNNATGRKYTKRFTHDFPKIVQSHSHAMLPFEDLNEALKNDFIIDFSQLSKS